MKQYLLKYHVKRIPNCTNFDEFSAWRKLASASMPSHSVWFCTDCTRLFQHEMTKQGRCDHPYIAFRMVNGDLEGYVKPQDDEVHNRTVIKLNRNVIKLDGVKDDSK